MTVIEVIKKYGLEDFKKSYKNVFGEARDTFYNLKTLANIEVKGISINFPTSQVTITLKTLE